MKTNAAPAPFFGARASRTALTTSFYLGMTLLALPFLFPFWWMITSSLKSADEIFGRLTLLPESWHWQNFARVFSYQPFAEQYFNSVYIAVIVTVGVLFLSSLAGFAFARIRFKGRSFLFLLLLSSLMMPTEVTIIPNFFLMKAFSLINTHVPLIVIPLFGAQGAFATFLMRQYFTTVPGELGEAARMDGLGQFGTLMRIYLPIATAALGAAAILTFLASWNDYLDPLVYLNSIPLFTLPVALNNFRDSYGLPVWELQLAATTLAVVPVLVVYVAAQRYITNVMAFSGLKG